MTPIDLGERFEWQEAIGEGRFATVHRYHDRRLQRQVAVKYAAFAGRKDDELRKLQQEFRISCRLRHPHIASALDGRLRDDAAILILPLCDGGSLPVQRCDGELIRQRVKQIGQVTSAVAYLHTRGILHGDIKPENILLDRQGAAFLCDFGSCRLIDADGDDEAGIGGTAAYLAPELAAGDAAPSVASDLYAIGATLFAVTCGRPPFEGDVHAMLDQARTSPFPDPIASHREIDRDLAAIILRACARLPQDRYQDTSELFRDLEAWEAGEPLLARPPGILRRAKRWAQQHRLATGLSIASLLLLLAGIAAASSVWLTSQRKLAALAASQRSLEVQGREAGEREAELSQLLVSIEADRRAMEASLAEESRLKTQAEELAAQARSELETAEVNLATANQLADSIAVTQQAEAASKQELAELNERQRIRDEYRAEAQRRLDLSRVLGNIAADRRYDLSSIPDELQASFPLAIARSPQGSQGPRGLPSQISFSGQAEQLVWNSSQDRIAISGKTPHVHVMTPTYERIEELWSEQRIPWARPSHSRDRFVAFSLAAKPEQIATAERVDSRRWIVRVWDLAHESTIATYSINEIPGRVFAMRCLDDQRVLLLVQDVAQRDLIWLDAASGAPVWSCREARDELGLSTDTGPWAPLFVEVGLAQAEGFNFLSADRPDEDGKSELVWHGFSADFSNQQDVFSLSIGRQDLTLWPRRIQVSRYGMLAAGSGRAGFRDPPLLSGPVFEVDQPAAVIDLQENGLALYRDQRWVPLSKASQAGYLDDTPLSLLRDEATEPHRLRELRQPWLDPTDGLIRYFHSRHGIEVIDLHLGDRVWRTQGLSEVRTAERVVWSPSGHQLVTINSDRLHVITFVRPNELGSPTRREIIERLRNSLGSATASQ